MQHIYNVCLRKTGVVKNNYLQSLKNINPLSGQLCAELYVNSLMIKKGQKAGENKTESQTTNQKYAEEGFVSEVALDPVLSSDVKNAVNSNQTAPNCCSRKIHLT